MLQSPLRTTRTWQEGRRSGLDIECQFRMPRLFGDGAGSSARLRSGWPHCACGCAYFYRCIGRCATPERREAMGL
eukprot:1723837-Pyramimonas_sp.AAC.1